MIRRMKWFKCPKCNTEFEDLVAKEDITTICECGAEATLLDDFAKQLHNQGWKYSNVSWSVHNAGD